MHVYGMMLDCCYSMQLHCSIHSHTLIMQCSFVYTLYLQLLDSGELDVDWLSPQFPDFLAKCKAAICLDLCSSLSTLHTFTSTLHLTTSSWSETPGLDIFAGEGENTLQGLQAKHRCSLTHVAPVLKAGYPVSYSLFYICVCSLVSSDGGFLGFFLLLSILLLAIVCYTHIFPCIRTCMHT